MNNGCAFSRPHPELTADGGPESRQAASDLTEILERAALRSRQAVNRAATAQGVDTASRPWEALMDEPAAARQSPPLPKCGDGPAMPRPAPRYVTHFVICFVIPFAG